MRVILAMRYRRERVAGATYFFTVVTFERRPILVSGDHPARMREAFLRVKLTHPFRIEAMVLLPDHIHCIWALPENDADFSMRWNLIKRYFTFRCDRRACAIPAPSRLRKREQGVWQRRFWEHRIRDEEDLRRHADYIHYNPVKHGYAVRPGEWPYSTFGRYVQRGIYAQDWGAATDSAASTLIGPE